MNVRLSALKSLPVGVALLLGLCSACATSPPVDRRGLPRISRYTNGAQLDFLLSRFSAVAQQAANAHDAELLTQACLGYERTIFDIESLRRYPMIIRMSSEGAALLALREELAGAVARNPPVAACAGGPTEAPPGQGKLLSAVPGAADDRTLVPGDKAPADPGSPQVEEGAPPKISSVRQFGSEVERERALLAELRLLLPPPPVGGKPPEEVPPNLPAPLDEEALARLAGSDLPTIRLRARFHQLGRCVQWVETTERYPIHVGGCAGAVPGEQPRHAQWRLMRSMLNAWRARYTEPMTDVVVGLANFVSRDNPVTDGPRPSR